MDSLLCFSLTERHLVVITGQGESSPTWYPTSWRDEREKNRCKEGFSTVSSSMALLCRSPYDLCLRLRSEKTNEKTGTGEKIESTTFSLSRNGRFLTHHCMRKRLFEVTLSTVIALRIDHLPRMKVFDQHTMAFGSRNRSFVALSSMS